MENNNWNFNESYLIIPESLKLVTREVPQRKGGIKYAVDQMKNENSLILSLGGYNVNDKAVIASRISTLHKSDFINNIFKRINKELKKYKKINQFYLSEDSYKLYLEDGVRLTENTSLHPDHDILNNLPS